MRVLLHGYGAMGRVCGELLKETEGFEVVGAVDPFAPNCFADFAAVNCDFDAILDFSKPEAFDDLYDYLMKKPKPVVIATTGLSDIHIKKIELLSFTIPVFYTRNMSLGVNVLQSIIELAAQALGTDFDIEIIEKHHNKKVDSPSGTAKMLFDTLAIGGDYTEIDGRQGFVVRKRNEIGISAVRGGNIVGEHTVIFAGNDEVLEFTHRATSKRVFAVGAVRALGFIKNKLYGLYNMEDLLQNGRL